LLRRSKANQQKQSKFWRPAAASLCSDPPLHADPIVLSPSARGGPLQSPRDSLLLQLFWQETVSSMDMSFLLQLALVLVVGDIKCVVELLISCICIRHQDKCALQLAAWLLYACQD
jgi:hypothetical protein